MSDPKSNILVVDDEPGLREVMALELELRGYRVFTAANGRAALEIVRENEIPLVVSDVRMPEGDGLELLDCIQDFSRRTGKVIRVILMTGFSGISREEALERGASEMLLKPFLIEEMMEVLSERRSLAHD